LAAEGYLVRVITGRRRHNGETGLPKRELHRGVEIVRVPVLGAKGRSTLARLIQYASFYPGAFVALIKLARTDDVIIAKTDPPLISVAAMWAARFRRCKLINWIQDLYPEVAIELGTPFLNGFVGRTLKHVRDGALHFADANVVIGSRMSERLRDLGIDPDKVEIIPNWSDELAIRPIDRNDSAVRESWGLTGRDFVIGYSGNLGNAHEVETLVGAAKILRERSEIKFLFVGGGRQHQRLHKLIAMEKLTNFLFKPHQPREQLADTLAAADVHWVSLRPELEGLIVPSKLYGILAAERPVLSICDERGEVSTLVREQGCGIVVAPGDSVGLASAIARLADDPAYCRAVGQRGRRASEQCFARASALGAWSRVISDVLEEDHRCSKPLASGRRRATQVR
jgi:glycosyltransferase involved in cell wall biosynthesis